MKKRGTWHLPVPLLEVLVYLISRSQKQSAWRRFPINRDKCGAKLYWLRSPSELGNLQMSVQNWEIKMKLPNFSATFYCLTTFLLGFPSYPPRAPTARGGRGNGVIHIHRAHALCWVFFILQPSTEARVAIFVVPLLCRSQGQQRDGCFTPIGCCIQL